MQSTSVAPLLSRCYPIPKDPNHYFHFHHRPLLKPKPTSLSLPNIKTHFNNLSFSLTHPNICNKDPENSHTDKTNSHPNNKAFFLQFHSPTDTNQNPNTQNPQNPQEDKEPKDPETKKAKGVFTNMWWADLQAALGQRFNLGGILSSAAVVVRDRHLALPHISVPDIRYVDWAELRRSGFRGVVFDKDNTITAPYSLTLWEPLGASLQRCKSVFGQDIAVFSNSAGLFEYDHDGSKARELESAIGINVIRHKVKKPAGTAEEIEKHFGCKSSQLIMVGDRPFIDVVFGNRNGFLTVLTEPLSLAEEPFIVRQVRKLETFLVKFWYRGGLKPASHNLLSDAMQFVKDPPYMWSKIDHGYTKQSSLPRRRKNG